MSLMRSTYQITKSLKYIITVMEDRQIRRRKKAILDILQKYIVEDELRFSKIVITTDEHGMPVQFNVVRMKHFIDPITESFEEHILCCEMLNGSNGDFGRLRGLSLDALLEIAKLIIEDKATLYSITDSVPYSKDVAELKAVLQANSAVK